MKHIEDVPAVSRSQMIEVDRLMIEEYGITLLQMMENAGRALALLARDIMGGSVTGKGIAVLCGGGNNGGGGMVAGRFLSNWGADVVIGFTTPEENLKDAPAHQLDTLNRMGLEVSAVFPSGKIDLIIDALIGYGLKSETRGKTAEWIRKTNSTDVPVLSLDIPSGLNADSGTPMGSCIRADATLTLALPKIGMQLPASREFVGDLYIGDIGVPPLLYREMGINMVDIFGRSPVIGVAF